MNRIGVHVQPNRLSDGSKAHDVQISNDGRIVITLNAIDEASAHLLADAFVHAVESHTNERVDRAKDFFFSRP